ncbi:hypothetical protein T06_3987 [Trichinella sp. T6]|nr:hypothetical protein T06_3987 [Trichinella sp. T6]
MGLEEKYFSVIFLILKRANISELRLVPNYGGSISRYAPENEIFSVRLNRKNYPSDNNIEFRGRLTNNRKGLCLVARRTKNT